MIHVPQELQRMIAETNRLSAEIQRIREKERPNVAEMRRLALLKAELLCNCPPERYAWVDGLPVVDILKTLSQQE